MTDSHWTLLALGAIFIVGVLLYNNLEARRLRRSTGDPVIVEPGAGSEGQEDDVATVMGTAADLPGEAVPDGQMSEPPEPQVSTDRPPMVEPASADLYALDSDIECVLRMRLPETQAHEFMDLIGLLRAVQRPFRMLGQREDGVWEPVGNQAATAYSLVDAGLQLASRKGPVTAAQLDEWAKHLRHFAGLHGGSIDCPSQDQVLERAADLDRFCVGVDVLVGPSVVAPVGYPFRGGAVHRLLEEAGMSLDPAGIYRSHDDLGNTLFTLADRDGTPFVAGGRGAATYGVVFSLDVPLVQDGVKVFDAMVLLAQDLASALSGALVDDRGHPYDPQNERRLLIDSCRRLRTRNIDPGSDRARRLFS